MGPWSITFPRIKHSVYLIEPSESDLANDFPQMAVCLKSNYFTTSTCQQSSCICSGTKMCKINIIGPNKQISAKSQQQKH